MRRTLTQKIKSGGKEQVVLIALTADNVAVQIKPDGQWVTFRARTANFGVSVPLSRWQEFMNLGRWTVAELRRKLEQYG